jgi:asparagine synthase (glutamine-hydrolysing)
MCGICGFVQAKSGLDKRAVEKMMKLMKHRGPDDEGMHLEDKVGLGHVRLSIIDLSAKGHQPMPNDDESLWIVYNGEIYNYIELREELKEKGATFKSKTDTEVLLKAYEHWGEKCLARLNGMFSFIIYDKKKNILFGARDRFGIKPFYYYKAPGKFIFASEIKPILSTGIKREPNYYAIHDFIMYRFMYQGESTFFNEIKKLLPGHYIKIDIESAKVETKKWWDIETELQPMELDKAVSRFDELFKDSVKIRLRSDVPVGSCLSGGLDSSSIVCTMVNILGSAKNVKTFS